MWVAPSVMNLGFFLSSCHSWLVCWGRHRGRDGQCSDFIPVLVNMVCFIADGNSGEMFTMCIGMCVGFSSPLECFSCFYQKKGIESQTTSRA